jgi:ATP-dependent DNA ligase
MLYAFSLPTKADKVPAGPHWLHEVKYDGYRMMVIREQDRVRLISSGGHDWARNHCTGGWKTGWRDATWTTKPRPS